MSVTTLHGIFLAEFDNTMGPKVTFESPADLINAEVFDAISECIIPKPWLFGKMISTYAFGRTYLGMPLNIEGHQYARNRMLFNVGLVLQPPRRAHSAEIAVFEPVVRKIGKTLETLEAETCFLSDESLKCKLGDLLERVLIGLKRDGKAVVPIDEANILHIILFPRPTSLPVPQVREHDVPVPLCNLKRHTSNEIDLVLQRISTYMDGARFIKQIAELADVDLELVIQSVQHLVCQDLVRLVDIFQYSNIYAATIDVSRLTDEPDLRRACFNAVVAVTAKNKPGTREIFSLYAGLQPGLRFADYCTRREGDFKGINRQKFVTFGVLNGIIRRVMPHPLYIPLPEESNVSTLISSREQRTKSESHLTTLELSLMDGKKSLDAICCAVARGPEELAEAIAAHPRCILVYK